MPRRLIIGILVVLILGVLGGTVALIVTRLRSDSPEEVVDLARNDNGQLSPSGDGPQQVTDPTGDDDDDGLSNADERLWGTNPDNPDTDGDGFLDGEEVESNHNPTIPGPNDELPEGFVPGRELTPLTQSNDQQVPVGQLFQEDLDLTGGDENLTEAYQDAFSENERTSATLAQFVNTLPVITQLPTPTENVEIEGPNTTVTLGNYLAVVGDLSPLKGTTTYNKAVSTLMETGNANQIRGLALQVQIYQEDLINTPVPEAASDFHQLIIGYTELIQASFDQMTLWEEDPVRVLRAINQLDKADERFYPILTDELERLQSAYIASAGL